MRAAEAERERIAELVGLRTGTRPAPGALRIHTDTSDIFRVGYGDIAVLGGRPYLVRNNEREGRFGLDDEPKFWVKRAVDLESGEVKILKLSFREEFQARVGALVFPMVRSPRKEARILDLVRGRGDFMQGFAVEDSAGNPVRVIDFITGGTLAQRIERRPFSHEEYFHGHFPAILREFVALAEAIGFLHEHGEKHGDIRRDHIFMDRVSGRGRWIDFDFNYHHADNPFAYDLFGLGHVLAFLAGGGDVTLHELQRRDDPVLEALEPGDLSLLFPNRVMNLGKVFRHLPARLGLVLRHFSAGAELGYERVGDLLEDLDGLPSA